MIDSLDLIVTKEQGVITNAWRCGLRLKGTVIQIEKGTIIIKDAYVLQKYP